MQQSRPRPRKEALFVRVPAPDDTVAFHNVTSHVGKPMPFSAPQATAGMRVSTEVVSFSLLHLTKKSAKSVAERVLEMPRGPLSRLERRAVAIDAETPIGLGDLVVEMEENLYRMKLERDENGVLSLEVEGEDDSFVLPKSSVRISLYMRSPGVGRLVAIGFIGHLGKPESTETVRRVAAMVLFSLSQLTEFKVLGGVETVTVPSNSARYAVRPTRKPSEKAAAVIPAYLFSETEMALLGHGTISVEVDLESANPTSNRLLFHVTPSAELEPFFEEYRSVIDSTISTHVRQTLSDEEVAEITYDIVLGNVSSGTVERLREALEAAVTGFDFTPRQYQVHGA